MSLVPLRAKVRTWPQLRATFARQRSKFTVQGWELTLNPAAGQANEVEAQVPRVKRRGTPPYHTVDYNPLLKKSSCPKTIGFQVISDTIVVALPADLVPGRSWFVPSCAKSTNSHSAVCLGIQYHVGSGDTTPFRMT